MNEDTRTYIEQSYFTDAVKHSGKPIAHTAGRHDGTTKHASINVSDILDKLIESVGRFTEHYLSDLIITWDYIRELIDNHKAGSYCVVVAPRKSGVDSNAYVLNNAEHYRNQAGRLTDYYRQIMAVVIHKTPKMDAYMADDIMEIEISLYDITNNMPHIKTDINGQSMLESMYAKADNEDEPTVNPVCELFNKPVNNIVLDEMPTVIRPTIPLVYPNTETVTIGERAEVYKRLSEICPEIYSLPRLINLFEDLQKHETEWVNGSAFNRNCFYTDMNGLNIAIHELSAKELTATNPDD